MVLEKEELDKIQKFWAFDKVWKPESFEIFNSMRLPVWVGKISYLTFFFEMYIPSDSH
jgi:hypothetical protein